MSNRKLCEVLEHVKLNDFRKLLTDLLALTIRNQRSISIIGWEFNTSCTIYCDATASEVVSGWKFLRANDIPLDMYVKAFLIKSVDDLLNPEQPKEFGDWMIDIKSEPEVLELLRLCFWINKCRLLNYKSFEKKFSEIKDQLALGNKLGENFAKRCRFISRILLNSNIPQAERNHHKTCFLNELNKFRITVSSFVSEIMICAVLQIEGFVTEFPARDIHKKICDIRVNSHKAEVKTIFDRTKFSETEDTLCKELEATLKKQKIVDQVNDALSKDPDVIFLVLTFSSVGVSMNDYAAKGKTFHSIVESVDNCIKLSSFNISKVSRKSLNDIPIVILVTGIDSANKLYRLSSLPISYPVHVIKKKLEVDREKLVIYPDLV